MSRRPVQGQSQWTRAKAESIDAAFAANTAIVAAIGTTWRRPPTYWHFDLFAGCGWNDDVAVAGSPLLFLEQAKRHLHERFRLFCVENNPDQAKRLQLRLQRHECAERCTVHVGDNAEFLPAVPHILSELGEKPGFALGSAFIDPNDVSVDWDAIERFSQACPRIDLIANLSATAFKRVDGALNTGFRLEEAIARMNKRHWTIRQAAGCQQWTVVFGRNFKPNDRMRRLGFAPLDSDEGKRMLRHMQMTREEIERDERSAQVERQQSLFPSLPELSRLPAPPDL